MMCRIEPVVLGSDPMKLGQILPESFQNFWDGQTLPSSPFRRVMPRGVIGTDL